MYGGANALNNIDESASAAMNDASEAAAIAAAGVEEPKVYVLTRRENAGYVSFESDTSIIHSIANIFPLFFFSVFHKLPFLRTLVNMQRCITDHEVSSDLLFCSPKIKIIQFWGINNRQPGTRQISIPFDPEVLEKARRNVCRFGSLDQRYTRAHRGWKSFLCDSKWQKVYNHLYSLLICAVVLLKAAA